MVCACAECQTVCNVATSDAYRAPRRHVCNEQVFVGQWPKGQIKYARLITTTPPENTSPRDTRGKVSTYPSDRSSKGNLGITEFEGQVLGGDEGKSYLAGIMATDNVTVTDT